MVNALILGKEPAETAVICNSLKEEASMHSDEVWKYYCFSQMEEVTALFKEHPMLDIICFDMTKQGAVQVAEQLRKDNPAAYIIVIADLSISPAVYMRPGIMASSLMLRPVKQKEARNIFAEMFAVNEYLKKSEDKEDVFIIEGKDGRYRIPYSRISYMEARQKKVFLYTDGKEIAFYDTLDNLSESLPKNFLRCHRSFVVNAEKIRKVMLSQNTIELEDEIVIPISRSYKTAIKEYK
ncbi:MAG: LytTR family transcriptional regulator [Lachnospiraceae bacterium]|nr:LytTR family transcriptional regulator [Lachnospiraceae bacterium]